MALPALSGSLVIAHSVVAVAGVALYRRRQL